MREQSDVLQVETGAFLPLSDSLIRSNHLAQSGLPKLRGLSTDLHPEKVSPKGRPLTDLNLEKQKPLTRAVRQRLESSIGSLCRSRSRVRPTQTKERRRILIFPVASVRRSPHCLPLENMMASLQCVVPVRMHPGSCWVF